MTDSLIQGEIQKVSSLIAAARRHLADGKMVDLAALEGKVAGLTQAIRSGEVTDKEPVRDAVKAILESLDGLAGELTTQYETVSGGESVATPGRAAAAYEKAGDDG